MSLLSRLDRARDRGAAIDPASNAAPESEIARDANREPAPEARITRASQLFSEADVAPESASADGVFEAHATGVAAPTGAALFAETLAARAATMREETDDDGPARGFGLQRGSERGEAEPSFAVPFSMSAANAATPPASLVTPPFDTLARSDERDLNRNESARVFAPSPNAAPDALVETRALPGQSHLSAYFDDKHTLFDAVLGSLDPRLWERDSRDPMRGALEKSVDTLAREMGVTIDRAERDWLVREFAAEVLDFGPLTPFLDDPAIGKIVVNGYNDVLIERLGAPERTPIRFRDDDHLLSLIRRVAELVGGRIDAKMPLLDRPMPDGSRVRAKVPPLAQHPSLTIEKGNGNPFDALRRKQVAEPKPVSQPYAQLRERIQQRMLRELDGQMLGANPDALRSQVEEMISGVIADERVAMTRAERAALVVDLLNEIVGLGPIEPLLNDPEIDEVMVNGPFQVYAEKRGKLVLTQQRFRDNAHVMQIVERILAPLGRRVDEKSPMVDGRLRDGSRFNAIVPPLALGGPTLTIRKFARDPFTMTDLINFGTISRESAQFLQAAVEGRLNIVVSGGTGSGKTTTLNVLSSFIPSTERIVTIEDAAELQMRQEHVIRLETRPANIEGAGEIAIRDLVRNCLRMRPDRIVVGECRGAEALDMLQAMNTGHDGSLTTGHANTPRDMLKRLETMVMMAGFDLPIRAIREQISMAVHLIVQQDRMRDGVRRVTAVTEVQGMEGDTILLQDIFRFEQEGLDHNGKIIGKLQGCGLRPRHMDEIEKSGIKLPPELFQPGGMTYQEPGAREGVRETPREFGKGKR